MRSFISSLESLKLSLFKRGHEVHESLCLVLRNHRDVCLDLRGTFTNFKQCLDNYYYISGADKNCPNIFVESQAQQLIERLAIWLHMIYETIENETL